ncbi:MAG TPA: hypothetical protein VN130_07305 [Xanthobacteraceae bacterium]|jgi:hypothetical protein|nr:hypothetical protein [Xanthobacteraceae bacterium]
MNMPQLPPAVELGRLRRLKEAVIGAPGPRQSSIVATDDWIADIDARLSELERAVLPPSAGSLACKAAGEAGLR